MFSIDLIKQKIAVATADALGVSVESEWIENSNPKAGSHLALPCFRFSKQLSSAPDEIAKRIASTMEVESVSKVEAQGAYLNFWIQAGVLAEGVVSSKSTSLRDQEPNNQTVIVEYLSPNLAKPLSIGHMRNILQGRAISLMYTNAGYNVITDNHIGDWGTVFGMWVVGFQKFSDDEKLAIGGVKELGRMYVEMRTALKNEEGNSETPLANEVQEWLIKLEDDDAEALEYHARFKEISLESITMQVADWDIAFDNNLGESFYISRGKEIVQELIESGDATQNNDGSVVVDLAEQGVDTPMLIQKSNGAALYHTSDIATVEYREKTWNPETVIYVVGMEQQFHFKQLFAANKKIGWSDAELIHHWYGLIEEVDENGKRTKMSSRKNAIYLEDLSNLALEKASEVADDDMSDEDVKIIAQGAVTFQEFSASHRGNIVFDWASMFSLSGYSGPYVQYAVVRINSILAKVDEPTDIPPSDYNWDDHADILWLLNQYDSVVDEAMNLREFHKLAEYSYELARGWNRLYENVQILSSTGDDQKALVWMAQTIGQYLERSLYLIGIKIPSRM